MRSELAIALLGLAAFNCNAAELTSETVAAWDRYVQTIDSRMHSRSDGERPFLWVDEDPKRAERVRQGEILVSHPNSSGSVSVPHGLIHDWNGAAFLPNTTLTGVLSVLRDYDRYKEFYKPAVVNSAPLEQSGNDDRFKMTWMQKVLFVTAALDGTYKSSYVRLSDKRGYSVTSSTRVQEIQNYGEPDEQMLPPDQGRGYLWRLYSVSRFEERDGGVYIEVEAVALSRDIPGSLHWLVAPVVDRLSKNSVAASLRATRDAVCTLSDAGETVARGPGALGH
jgi:hypothetical protein